MILHEVQQGSLQWLELRLGRVTSSDCKKIITPVKGELSKSSTGYMYLLIAERLLNRPLTSLDGLEWIEHGKATEPQAVKAYEFEQEVQTKPGGFITTDDGLIGTSLDRLLVDTKGGLEIKCPAPQNHIAYMVEGFGNDYKVQVQSQMYVAELDFVDRFSYHEQFKPVRERTGRDEPFIKLLKAALDEFNDKMLNLYEKIKPDFYAEQSNFKTVEETAYVDMIENITSDYEQLPN